MQNWHRDCDPSLGRYIEADPLGLDAGQSLYGYVGQDPLGWIDPEGLDVTITLKGYRLSGVPGALGNGHAFVEIKDNTTGKKIGVRAGPVRGLPYQLWAEAIKENHIDLDLYDENGDEIIAFERMCELSSEDAKEVAFEN